jgi:hypothetical protein
MPMTVLHPKERERLDSCSERFRPLAWRLYNEVNAMCSTENCAPLVVYGFRSAAEQLQIWAQGRELIGPGLDTMLESSWRETKDTNDKIVTRAFPGRSAHNTGDAVDIALVEGVGATRHWISDPGVPGDRWYRIVGAAAKRLGLRWGGDFSFFDGAHVQHPEWTLKDRRR